MIASLRRCVTWLALLGAGLFLLCASAAAAPTLQASREELRALREQVRAVQNEIARGEAERNEAAEQLSEAERNISDAQRRLREISGDRAALDAELRRLEVEAAHLTTQLAAARERLGQTLYQMYVEGGGAGARRLFGSEDANQMARDAWYLEQIARARAEDIARAREALAQLQAVQEEVLVRRNALQALEGERRSEQERLVDERNKRRRLLAEAAERIRAQRREMQNLQRGQARLEKLLQGLERIARERAAAARKRPARPPVTSSSRSSASQGSARAVTEVAVPGAATAADFARLQGRLRWPVRGELHGRFGSPRGEGGIWRGVFIAAPEGSEVRAVADGKVAFADWLRGFGNLLIVDHGGGYMTIYANNDALFKTPGQPVRTGEAIASVGASGGQEESGLYFEIRHRGEPADPLKWIAAR